MLHLLESDNAHKLMMDSGVARQSAHMMAAVVRTSRSKQHCQGPAHGTSLVHGTTYILICVIPSNADHVL